MTFRISPETELLLLLGLSAAGYFLARWMRKNASLRFIGPSVALVLLAAVILFKLFEPAWAADFGYYFCFGSGLCYLTAFCIPLGIAAVLDRVPTRSRRIVAGIFSVLVLLVAAYVPAAAALWVRADLASSVTTFTPNGVCLQNTDYTCGPAAAVTALDQLGIDADESDIAMAVRTSPWTGTRIGDLGHYLNTAYRAQGLSCRIRKLDSLDQLAGIGPAPTLVSLKESPILEHCVAVLEVSEHGVTLADPWIGIRTMSPVQFRRQWTGRALILSRDSS